ncbi:unnamed protein product [Rhodiola kirilowii]
MNDQGTSHQQGQVSSNTQDNTMMSMMAQMLENQKETNKRMEQLEAHNKVLENQVAQQAVALKQYGKLPSQPDVNSTEHCNAIFLKDEEPSLVHINAITLKSGRVLPTPQGKPNSNDKEIEARVANENSEVELQTPPEEKKKEEEPALMRYYVPMVPFPQRLVKTTKLDKEFGKFVDVLKKLYVHMPFVDLISKAPLYRKFLKEILSNKRKIEEDESHLLISTMSVALFSQSKFPSR